MAPKPLRCSPLLDPSGGPSGSDPDSSAGRAAGAIFRHRSDLLAYLRIAVRNAHDAEDLLQEVCLIAIQRAPAEPEILNPRAWAMEIARNCAMNHLRKRSRRSTPVVLQRVLERLEGRLLSRPEDPDAAVREREALQSCLETLGARIRKALRMRYHDRRAVPDIASALGRTVDATYDLLDRARRALRRCTERRLSAGGAP